MTEPLYKAEFRIPSEKEYGFTHVTVIGNTLDEFVQNVKDVSGAAEALYLAEITLRTGLVDAELVGTEVVPQANPVPQAVPQPAPSRPRAAASQPPTCAHGPRNYVTGTGRSGRPWAGWFCALPKGSPGQCAPVWVEQ